MKHRLHDFSARPCQMAGRAESPCQRAMPVQYFPRCQSWQRADSDRLKAFFIAPSVPFSFEAGLTRKGQLLQK
jgi:hypothetical protein